MLGNTDCLPKKAMPFDGNLFKIIGAHETVTMAQHEMTLLDSGRGSSPFPADAVIHDSACILATGPPSSIKIHATDVAPPMTAIFNQSAEAKNWPCKAEVMDATFSHVLLSFGLPIIEGPVAAASEMYRTLKPGGIAVTAFWLHDPQGERAIKVNRAIRGPDTRLTIEPNPKHGERGYTRSLLVKGGFKSEDCQLREHSAFLHVESVRDLATAIWSAIGRPKSGWTNEDDDDEWDKAIAKYEELLPKEPGSQVDGGGNVTLKGTAQIVIARKEA